MTIPSWTLYTALGIAADADDMAVRAAVKQARFAFHPDRHATGNAQLFTQLILYEDALGMHRDRYDRMLLGDYPPHGGTLLDENAMAAFLSGRSAYSPRATVDIEAVHIGSLPPPQPSRCHTRVSRDGIDYGMFQFI
jgi:curved DNA-binding protein CbpA